MMRAAAPEQIGYFGKLPGCADFVKQVQDLATVEVLDEWMVHKLILILKIFIGLRTTNSMQTPR